MFFNQTEADNKPAITEYKEEPTWTETMKASFTAGIVDNTSMAKHNYRFSGVDEAMKSYESSDPDNENVYRKIRTSLARRIDHYETLYEQGQSDKIEGLPQGKDYLKFKELEGLNGNPTLQDIYVNSDEKAKEEYTKANQVLKDADHWTAELVGRGGAMFTDPFFLSTLPVGGSVATGGGMAVNAGKAFLTESALETGVQTITAPTVYSYKKELGIKTSILQEATNAVSSVAMAGAGRAVGSVLFDAGAKALGKGEFAPLQKDNLDLSQEGINSLKEKDPELGKAYQNLEDTRATQDMDEHMFNLHEASFDNPPSKIKTPNAHGQKLNEAEAIPIENPDIIKAAQETNINIKEEDLKLFSGVDQNGEDIYKTYKELDDELIYEEATIQKAKDCFL